MLNLFKKMWLPSYIRECIQKKFPEKYFRVDFRIDGKDVEMGDVVGNERNIEFGIVTYTDSEGNSVKQWLFLHKGEISFSSVERAESGFMLKGIEPDVRKPPLVGKKGEVEKYREMLKKKLSDAMDWKWLCWRRTSTIRNWMGKIKLATFFLKKQTVISVTLYV